MLECLRIQNLALIEDVELEFCAGLTVLSGESGAGKSFILRALDFILGERVQASLVRPGNIKAVVEAAFCLDGEDVLLRRELSGRTGRSRLYINNALASQERLAALRPRLLLHTSQHGQQRLLAPERHTEILDTFLEDQNVLSSYLATRSALQGILHRKYQLRERLQGLEERREFLEYQLAEIKKIDPQPGEEEALLQERAVGKEGEKQRLLAGEAQDLLLGETGLQEMVRTFEHVITLLGEQESCFTPYGQSLREFRENLGELGRELRVVAQAEDRSGDFERIEKRLWDLQQLQRKLKRPLEALVALGQEIEENLSFLDESALALKALEREEKECAAVLSACTKALNLAREQTAQQLSSSLQQELQGLGFSEHLKVCIEFSPQAVYKDICELRPRFLWVPNPGIDAQPLDEIASGGELSRFLLALVSLRSREALPALLFDEVDSGIGGRTLLKVAERIHQLSRLQQVILVTHWPQLARFADEHYAICKEVVDGQTFTRCTPLREKKERDQELARMAGAEGVSSA